MKRFYFKEMVESPNPPKDTHMLWVDKDESTGDVLTIKKFKDNNWTTSMLHCETIDITDPNNIQTVTVDGFSLTSPSIEILNKCLTPTVFYSEYNYNGVIVPFYYVCQTYDLQTVGKSYSVLISSMNGMITGYLSKQGSNDWKGIVNLWSD